MNAFLLISLGFILGMCFGAGIVFALQVAHERAVKRVYGDDKGYGE